LLDGGRQAHRDDHRVDLLAEPVQAARPDAADGDDGAVQARHADAREHRVAFVGLVVVHDSVEQDPRDDLRRGRLLVIEQKPAGIGQNPGGPLRRRRPGQGDPAGQQEGRNGGRVHAHGHAQPRRGDGRGEERGARNDREQHHDAAPGAPLAPVALLGLGHQLAQLMLTAQLRGPCGGRPSLEAAAAPAAAFRHAAIGLRRGLRRRLH
jgi:hypothetical protein